MRGPLFLALLTMAAPALAEPDAFQFRGTYRVRYEALEGQFRPGLDPRDDLVTLRAILFGEYDAGPIRIGVEVRDSRAYDADAGGVVGTNEVNVFEPTQAYIGVDLGDAFGAGSDTRLEIGRFTLDLGSRRLIADDNFRNATNSYTGVRGEWGDGKGASIAIFATLPQTRLPNDKASILDNDWKLDREGFDQIFWGGLGSMPIAGGTIQADAYLLGLDERDRADNPTRNRHHRTIGARLFRAAKAGQWDFDLEGAYQFGTIRASNAPGAARQDVSAAFAHIGIGRRFAAPWQPRIEALLDFATGDGRDAKFGRFDAPFGARSGDFGAGGIYGPMGRSNIVAPGVRADVLPDERWDAYIAYRAFWLAAETDSFASTGVRDPTGASGDFAGQHIEFRGRYWIVPDRLRLQFGGAWLMKGRVLEDAPNAPGSGDTVYGYSDITLSF